MSKLPTKQIYLLLIIIVGLVALSVYSTYAIFTLEGETSSVVTIHTPNTLKISENISEYRQITLPQNTYITTDIDIYNTYNYDLCYSTWYKIPNKSIDPSSIKVLQITDTPSSSGVIPSITPSRITLLIINDNDYEVKINIGISSNQKKETCALNIDDDKTTITKTINSIKELSTYIKENITETQTHDSGYITYENLTKEIILPSDKTIYISKEFTFKNEIFTLTNPQELELKDSEDMTTYENLYICIESKECRQMYQIKELTESTINNEDTYKIKNYNLLEGYLDGTSGIKKVTTNDTDNYIYYGDNPNNFIYYNCTNEQDTKTCELWRIIGTYYDTSKKTYLTKIIRNDYLEPMTYQTNKTNYFNTSSIKEYLTTEYQNNNSNYLQKITYNEEYLDELNQTKYLETDITSNINIINITDYLNASDCNNLTLSNITTECLQRNYLNRNQEEWTRTLEYKKISTDTDEEDLVNDKVYTVGPTIKTTTTSTSLSFRPVVYLKSRILLAGGTGTIEDPYQIK